MIYITGDLHGDIKRFSDKTIASLGNEDYLIICGDFGFVWGCLQHDTVIVILEKRQLDELEKLPFTILFVDGNHENFDRLETEFSEVEKFGDLVHQLRTNVFHLQRGRVYTIEGKRFYTFGGASSIDKAMRMENVSWWSRELPEDFEYERGTASLKAHDFKVDYIITHTAPVEVVKTMGFNPYLSQDMELMSYLSYVMENTEYKQWYFGHWHTDESIDLITKSNLFSPNRKSGESIKSEVKSFIAIYKKVVAIPD